MRYALIVVIGVMAIHVGSAAACHGKDLFPLAAGNTWRFESESSRTTRNMSIVRQAGGLVLQGFPGSPALRVRTRGARIDAWDTAAQRWRPFLRLGLPKGSAYRVDLGANPMWRGVRVAVKAKGAKVNDPSDRSYEGCTTLSFRPGRGVADAGLLEMSFCPGIGPVVFSEQTLAGPRAWALSTHRVR
jgi:hypothetical protein